MYHGGGSVNKFWLAPVSLWFGNCGVFFKKNVANWVPARGAHQINIFPFFSFGGFRPSVRLICLEPWV